MSASLRLRAAIVSIALFVAFLGIWHIATRGTGAVANMTPEYAKLMVQFEPGYPAARALAEQLRVLDSSIAREESRLGPDSLRKG